MNKPKKKLWNENNTARENNLCHNYNTGRNEMEAFHKWDIENNYIAKNRLLSVDEIINLIRKTIGKGYPIIQGMIPDIPKIAKAIHKAIEEKK